MSVRSIRSRYAVRPIEISNMVTISPTTRVRLLLVGKLLLMLVFAASFRQWSLYSSNQNQYFLHGLANAGVGFLNLDWLSQTVDPDPVFTALVSGTIRVLSENAFYFLYMAILAIYGFSILGIGSYVYDFGNLSTKYLFYFALFTMWYSGLLASLLSIMPALWRVAPFLDPNGLLTWGVARQYVLGHFFQPSTFGVFLLLSIYFFLHNKPFVAVACLAIAAIFHPVYLLSAAALTCTYVAVIVAKDKNNKKALLLGTIALVLVTPILAYIYLNFAPTSADIFARAQSILVDYRIPNHAQVTSWFGKDAVFQITIVALSIYLVRHTKLFPVLLVLFLTAAILTAVQVLTGNKSLALLFPWRVSVILVPIASSVILASIVSFAFQIIGKPISRIVRPLQAAILAVIIILGFVGVRRTIALLNTPRAGLTASSRFVASTFQRGSLYLIPPDIDEFRLAARVPIWIDYKSIPYKDTELVEWFNRVEIATDFYASSGDKACSILKSTSDLYGITHVVRGSDSPIDNCGAVQKLYIDADFAIYEVQGRLRTQ